MRHAVWLVVFGTLLAVGQAEESGRTTVLLGVPELTNGIPGEGELTTDQIKAWLANKAIFQELDVVLPPGLALGANNI